jgi:rRNA maturation endonuclease Nob1
MDGGPRRRENRDFYRSVQRRSVRKRCQRCKRMVRILPDYAFCNSCADKIERGGDF